MKHDKPRGTKSITSYVCTVTGKREEVVIISNSKGGEVRLKSTGAVICQGNVNHILSFVAARQTWRETLTTAFMKKLIKEEEYYRFLELCRVAEAMERAGRRA